MADQGTLLDETFTINNINPEKYDRVSRISGTTSDGAVSMTLDINHELFHVSTGDQVNLVLASTLSTDSSNPEPKGWRDLSKGAPTLADMYEYVCHGKNYRFEAADQERSKFYASFGGLLLCIEAPNQKLKGLRIDNVYMLLKK